MSIFPDLSGRPSFRIVVPVWVIYPKVTQSMCSAAVMTLGTASPLQLEGVRSPSRDTVSRPRPCPADWGHQAGPKMLRWPPVRSDVQSHFLYISTQRVFPTMTQLALLPAPGPGLVCASGLCSSEHPSVFAAALPSCVRTTLEIQRSRIVCLRSHSQPEAEPDFQPGSWMWQGSQHCTVPPLTVLFRVTTGAPAQGVRADGMITLIGFAASLKGKRSAYVYRLQTFVHL